MILTSNSARNEQCGPTWLPKKLRWTVQSSPPTSSWPPVFCPASYIAYRSWWCISYLTEENIKTSNNGWYLLPCLQGRWAQHRFPIQVFLHWQTLEVQETVNRWSEISEHITVQVNKQVTRIIFVTSCSPGAVGYNTITQRRSYRKFYGRASLKEMTLIC
jgi:hypothetical protein